MSILRDPKDRGDGSSDPSGRARRERTPGTLASAFSRPAFRRIWFGNLASNIGTWMETVALGYYVADQTRLAVWSAVIAAAGFIPIAVIGPIGGALADRRSREVILLLAMSAQAVVAIAVTVLVAVDRYLTVSLTESTDAGSVHSPEYGRIPLRWTRSADGLSVDPDHHPYDYVLSAITVACDSLAATSTTTNSSPP